MQEVRLLVEQELQWAVDTANEVFELCVRAGAGVLAPEKISRHYSYASLENLRQGVQSGQLFVWGVFENGQMNAMSAMQDDAHITMLYVKTAYQRRGMGGMLLQAMSGYAATILQRSGITIDVMPVTAASYFYHRGFQVMPQGAQGNGIVSLVYSFDTQGQMHTKPHRQEVCYTKKKIKSKTILWVTAVVLVLAFGITTGITVHHLVGEERYTEEDLYGTSEEQI